jgi:hypothetical protein
MQFFLVLVLNRTNPGLKYLRCDTFNVLEHCSKMCRCVYVKVASRLVPTSTGFLRVLLSWSNHTTLQPKRPYHKGEAVPVLN